METTASDRLFTLTPPVGGPLTKRALGLVESALTRLLCLHDIERAYQALPRNLAPGAFIDATLEAFGVRCNLRPQELAHIPAKGPVVVVANHPFGGLEGLVLARMLLTVRPDARVMANALLARIPELRDLFIFVDPFGGSTAYVRQHRSAQAVPAGSRRRWSARCVSVRGCVPPPPGARSADRGRSGLEPDRGPAHPQDRGHGGAGAFQRP